MNYSCKHRDRDSIGTLFVTSCHLLDYVMIVLIYTLAGIVLSPLKPSA